MQVYVKDLNECLPWIARTKGEKAKARRLLAKGIVTLDPIRETYIRHGRVIGYEALYVVPTSKDAE